MKVFFDASVVIAALLSPTGGSSLLLQYVKTDRITGITSQTVIEEMIEEDKPERLKRSKKEIEDFIAQTGLIVREHITPKEIEPYEGVVNAEDAHLFAGANLTQCEYLVSLDKKHVVRQDLQEKFLPLRIVSPKEILEEIVNNKT